MGLQPMFEDDRSYESHLNTELRIMTGSKQLLSLDAPASTGIASRHGLEAHATGELQAPATPGRVKAFTLTEMLVVMGIMVLFITLAVPAVRVLMGSSSIAMTRNNLSALIAR